MTTEHTTLRLGIARCLLGENVRYDGTHKLDPYLRDTLGSFVEWVPVCPEVECGMSVPREPVRLAGDPESPRLVGRNSGEDWTEHMRAWGEKKLAILEKEDLCGWIFRYGSPSNGMSRVKVYGTGGMPTRSGTGLWAGMVMDHFPFLPFEDDGRLRNPAIRENFISRVFTLKRWRDAMAGGRTPGALVEFHTRHKLLAMAHSVEAYRTLGKLVARAGSEDVDTLCDAYFRELSRALALRQTTKKNVNVLSHAMGYFKRDLPAAEKAELLTVIEQYHRGLIPLIVPITLLNHHVRKYGKEYLAKQYYLNPYPAELMLRNHP